LEGIPLVEFFETTTQRLHLRTGDNSGIVDIEPSSGDVYKRLLGSFVVEFHENKDDEGDDDGLLAPVPPAIDSSSQSSEFARQNIDPPPLIPSRRNVLDLRRNPDSASPKRCSQIWSITCL